MYPVSETFQQAVQENTRKFYWTGRITTKDGRVYEFGNADIVKDSCYITSQYCGSTEIEISEANQTLYRLEIKTYDYMLRFEVSFNWFETVGNVLAIVSYSCDFIIDKENIVLKAVEQAKNPLYMQVNFGHIEGNRKVFSTQNSDDVVKHITFQNYGIELEVTFSTNT